MHATDFLNPDIPNETLPKPTDVATLPSDLLRPHKKDLATDRSLWVNHTCEHCHVTAVTQELWQKHINGRSHRQVIKRKLKNGQIELLNVLRAASNGTEKALDESPSDKDVINTEQLLCSQNPIPVIAACPPTSSTVSTPGLP